MQKSGHDAVDGSSTGTRVPWMWVLSTRARHSRMRVFDRDLIRGRHYGQRSCEPQRSIRLMKDLVRVLFQSAQCVALKRLPQSKRLHELFKGRVGTSA